MSNEGGGAPNCGGGRNPGGGGGGYDDGEEEKVLGEKVGGAWNDDGGGGGGGCEADGYTTGPDDIVVAGENDGNEVDGIGAAGTNGFADDMAARRAYASSPVSARGA